MHTYPHKIENGEGEVITFLGVVIETVIAWRSNSLLRLMSVRRCICTIFRKRPSPLWRASLGFSLPVSNRYAEPGETIILKQGWAPLVERWCD